MRRLVILLVLLASAALAMGLFSIASADPSTPPASGEEFEVVISWNAPVSQAGNLLPTGVAPESDWIPTDEEPPEEVDEPVWMARDGRWLTLGVDGAVYDVGWTVAEGTADSPLTVWTALEVESNGSYTVHVQSVYGEIFVEAVGEGGERYDSLGGSDPLWIAYEGHAPAQVRLFGRRRSMSPEPVEGGLVRYDTGEAVIPPGVVYRSSAVTIQPGSGVKAAMVCAVWGGESDLHLVFKDVVSGGELGHADLSPVQPCSPIWGRVNRPFVVEVSADDVVQLYDLSLR